VGGRLLIVTAEFPFGSGEIFLLPELAELKFRCEQLLIVPRSPDGRIVHDIPKSILDSCTDTQLLDVRICWIAFLICLRHPFRVLKAFFLLFQGWGLRNWIKNAAVFPKALWLADVALRENITHIHAHWGTTTSTMTMIASLVTGIPWSMTLHRVDILLNNLLLTKCKKASFVRFISEDGLKLAERVLGKTFPGRSKIIHLGIPIPDVPFFSGFRKTQRILFCPARLDEIKDHKSLFQALRILIANDSSVQLWLAGDGSQRKNLQEYVIEQKLERNVRFLGQYAHEKIIDLYTNRSVDIVVLSSLYEGVPVSLLEAMAHGIPVIGTNVGGTPELLGEGAGLLVPPRDPVALANALESLLHSREEYSLRARKGYLKVKEGWDAKVTTEQLLSAIRDRA